MKSPFRTKILALCVAASLWPVTGVAEDRTTVADMVLGSPDAPVTMVMYCGFARKYCAAFHKNIFPRIKINYIVNDNVRLIYREVYYNLPDIWGSMIARCAPADRYFRIVALLYSQEEYWFKHAPEEIMQKLYSVERIAGLTNGRMDECMSDTLFYEALLAWYQKNAAADDIYAVPSFLINGKKPLIDRYDYDEFVVWLDAALSE